jgi:hypothetical protein
MTDTIQIDLGGGASVALPAEKVTQALIARLLNHSAPRPNRYALGEYVPSQGGHFVGDIRGDDGVTYGLIAAKKDAGKATWGPDGTHDGFSNWDGMSNTNRIRDGKHPAALLTAEHEEGGHVDFYLPARRELIIAQANAPHLFEKSGWYCTSTPYGSYVVWVVGFEDGSVGTSTRRHEWRVRPFRRFTY